MAEEHQPVTVLGLGAMGTAIARTLADAGHPVTAWNRSAREALAGVHLADTPARAVAETPVTLLCVLDHGAALETLAVAGPELAGRAVVNVTSATPAQAREAAARTAQWQADYLDGSIMADPDDLGTERTSFLYSGSPAVFAAHRDLLERLGTTQFLGEDPGRAATAFTTMVAVGYETWLAYLDGLAYGAAEGFEARELAPMVTGMFGAMTGLMIEMAEAASSGHHPPAAGPLAVHAALMDDAIATRRAAGGDSAQLERVERLVSRAVADGRGQEGFSALFDQLGTRP